MNRPTYEKLIEENIAWLNQYPDTLERRHIEQILQRSAYHEFSSLQMERDELMELLLSLQTRMRDWQELTIGAEHAITAVRVRCASLARASGRDVPGQESVEDLPRTPDGDINNCALANGETSDTCQMCKGDCPDKDRVFPIRLPKPQTVNVFDDDRPPCYRCFGGGSTSKDAITPWKNNPCPRCNGTGKEP